MVARDQSMMPVISNVSSSTRIFVMEKSPCVRTCGYPGLKSEGRASMSLNMVDFDNPDDDDDVSAS